MSPQFNRDQVNYCTIFLLTLHFKEINTDDHYLRFRIKGFMLLDLFL